LNKLYHLSRDIFIDGSPTNGVWNILSTVTIHWSDFWYQNKELAFQTLRHHFVHAILAPGGKTWKFSVTWFRNWSKFHICIRLVFIPVRFCSMIYIAL
jgi:hypothetical protein